MFGCAMTNSARAFVSAGKWIILGTVLNVIWLPIPRPVAVHVVAAGCVFIHFPIAIVVETFFPVNALAPLPSAARIKK
jgi:hypothetical protein